MLFTSYKLDITNELHKPQTLTWASHIVILFQDGYWDLDGEEHTTLLGFSWSQCKEVLLDAGLKSLGNTYICVYLYLKLSIERKPS